MSEFISERQLFTNKDKIGVALSGGADSVALVSCMKKAGYDVTALHVEHGIRGEESLRDMRFVEQLCRQLDVALYVKRIDVPSIKRQGESIESAARRARYDYFTCMSEELGLKYIAVAHHIEDASETFILNLLRGSGLRGLSAMSEKREPNIVRPLLFATRQDIEDYLAEENLQYMTDSTNADTDYTRNYIRKEIIPGLLHINPAAHNTILRTSRLIAQEDEVLEELARKEYIKISHKEKYGVSMDAAALAKMNKAIARRVIRMACADVHGLKDVELSHIEAIYELARDGRTGRKFELKGRFFAQTVYNDLKIRTKDYIINNHDDTPLKSGETKLPKGRVIWNSTQAFCKMFPESLIQYVDGDELLGAVIRNRRQGDVFTPFGGGEKKLKDWFIDKKIPREERDELLLIAKESRILWVIGKAISQQIAVVENTRNLTRIEFISEPEEN